MKYKYELGNPLTDEIIQDIKQEAQKELLEEIKKEYLTKVNGELRYKELIKSLSVDTKEQNGKN